MFTCRAPEKPKVWTGPITEADAAARERREPLWAPASYFVDDRGWSLMNLMAGALSAQGQFNFSVQHPGVVKAWHRHALQTDFWICLNGHVKAGVFDQDTGRSWLQVIGERSPGVMIIPPPLWHGAATVGADRAGLFYYVTRAYDPAKPDEERLAHDAVGGFPWSVRHG